MVSGEKTEFHIVGIGASAGGLNALRTFFSSLPESPGLAYVVVVHLSPAHESHLVELLQPCTQLTVRQVVKTTALEPNHVYVIPPNANLNSIDTHLRLSELELPRFKRAPIDHFLRTLAVTHGETAIGIVLSGAGSDGALGIRQIKEHGGLTIAQDPAEAEFSSMPESAIATGTVDLVLRLREMAAEIDRYCATRPALQESMGTEEAAVLDSILAEVQLRTNHQFSMFTHAMVIPRVRRRMRLQHAETLAQYLAVMHEHHEEARALGNELLLNVTEFFRDPATYETLERLLGEILDRQQRAERVRIWSIGCSTGEEAYSLAMLVVEQVGARDGQQPAIQVFASELSPRALQQARDGVYPQEIAASVSADRLDRFFVHDNGRYRVRHELRNLVTFAAHDLFKDPPYSHLDLIVCRNLLHDLQPQMRHGVLGLFYYALEPRGALVIGQGAQFSTPGFVHDPSEHNVLRRVLGPRRAPRFPRPSSPAQPAAGGGEGRVTSFDVNPTFCAAVERYVPPSVLIDAENQVVHFSSSASRYVRIPGGEPSLDIQQLVPPIIARELRKGLEQVRGQATSWQSAPFAVAVNGQVRDLRVHVDRADSGQDANEFLLVLFEDSALTPSAPREGAGRDAMSEVVTLQTELARLHAQSAAQAEASKASGADAAEQLLQLDELEAAREELQALNEELLSLTHENQARMEKLAEDSSDLQSLLDSTRLALLQVDDNLKVVRFTALAADVFHLKESDIGRPVTDLAHALRYPEFASDLSRVAEHSVTVDVEVEGDAGHWFLVRMQPSEDELHGHSGMIVILVDITQRKRAEIALIEADRRKDEFLAVLAHELRNPLAPIRSGIEVMRKLPDLPEQARAITAIMARQMQQLLRLVDDLLEVSRISGGKLNLHKRTVRISEIVQDAVAAVQPYMSSLEHELKLVLPDEALFVDADAARLTQVISNLLHNAARYTEPRGKIELVVRSVGDDIELCVHDNGRGMTAEAVPHVFEMFYQGGRDATHATIGLGIGLTLAKQLVELHSGSITADSSGPGKGSTFKVRLPLSTRHQVWVDAQDDTAGRNGDRHRVLIVDDNADAAETLRLLMTTLSDGEIKTALSGIDALEIGAQLRPDIVLLDLGMPGMDGYEVARRMRGEPWGKDAILVALTGWDQEQHRRRTQEAGFDRHMTKPAEPALLRAVLDRAAERA